ncbi:hypothetical protein L1887_49913 [Cichorium endivia]|nr:hypothetical protein L1887_49913 [Cichorium endivia]
MTHSPPPKRDAQRRSPTIHPFPCSLPSYWSWTPSHQSTDVDSCNPVIQPTRRASVNVTRPSFSHVIPALETVPSLAHSLCLEKVARYRQDLERRNVASSHPRILRREKAERSFGRITCERNGATEQRRKDSKGRVERWTAAELGAAHATTRARQDVAAHLDSTSVDKGEGGSEGANADGGGADEKARRTRGGLALARSAGARRGARRAGRRRRRAGGARRAGGRGAGGADRGGVRSGGATGGRRGLGAGARAVEVGVGAGVRSAPGATAGVRVDDLDGLARGQNAVHLLLPGGEVPLVLVVRQALELGDGAGVPVVLLERTVVRLERVDGLVGGLVLERDEAGAVVGGGPAGHLADDARLVGADAGGARLELRGAGALAQAPVVGVLVPHDGLHAEHLGGDGAHTSVDVTLGRAPVHGHASSQVVDDLHGPAEVAEDLHVGLARLERVGPGVDTEVHGRVRLDVGVHHVRVPDDGAADEEVGGALLLLLEVLDERGRLRGGAVVKGDGDGVVGREPDVARVALLDGPGADVGHVGAGGVDGGAGVGVSDGARDVGDETGSLLGVVAVDPGLGQRAGGGRVGAGGRVGEAVLGGGGELALGDAVGGGALGEEVASGVISSIDKAALVEARGRGERGGQSHGSYGSRASESKTIRTNTGMRSSKDCGVVRAERSAADDLTVLCCGQAIVEGEREREESE